MKRYKVTYYIVHSLPMGLGDYKVKKQELIEAESFKDARKKIRDKHPRSTGFEIKEEV